MQIDKEHDERTRKDKIVGACIAGIILLWTLAFCSTSRADSSTPSPTNTKLALGGALTLQWSQATDVCADGKPYADRCPVVSWRVERMDNGKAYASVSITELPSDAREYTPETITTTGTYCFRVAARSGGPVAGSTYTYSNPRCVDVADVPSYPKAAVLTIKTP